MHNAFQRGIFLRVFKIYTRILKDIRVCFKNTCNFSNKICVFLKYTYSETKYVCLKINMRICLKIRVFV